MEKNIQILINKLLSSGGANRQKFINELESLTDNNPSAAFEAYVALRHTQMIDVAFDMIFKAVRMNYPKAEIMLAYEWSTGEYLEENLEKALIISKIYSEVSTFAENLAGVILYKQGKISEALSYFASASSKGNADSSQNIGYLICMNCLNNNLPIDYEKMLGWFELAVSQGSVKSCELAALTYLDINNIPEAKKYINIGCARGSEECFALREELDSPFAKIKDKEILMSSNVNTLCGWTGETARRKAVAQKEQERAYETRKNSLICGIGYLIDEPYIESISKHDVESGFFVTRDGKKVFVDDYGGIYTDKGLTIFDNDTKTSLGAEGSSIHSDDMRFGYYKS